MAINLNISGQPGFPLQIRGDKLPTSESSTEPSGSNNSSTQFVSLSTESQQLPSSQTVNSANPLDVIDLANEQGNINQFNSDAETPATSDQQLNSLQRQRSDIASDQGELRNESERIEQQIRDLERQERAIDQRIDSLERSQNLGQIIDLNV